MYVCKYQSNYIVYIYFFEVDALLPDSCDPLNGHHPMIQVDSSNRWWRPPPETRAQDEA